MKCGVLAASSSMSGYTPKTGHANKPLEQELGHKFDVREFHYMILKNGSIPLFTLERIMNQWIENQKKM